MLKEEQTCNAQQGVVHGHIHNYNYLTYIHGHVHNGLIEEEVEREKDFEGFVKEDEQRRENVVEVNEMLAEVGTSRKRDIDCSKFQDCQHFEFINYHNLNLFQRGRTRDAETAALPPPEQKAKRATHADCTQCHPKVMEVCCEQLHSSEAVPRDVILFNEKLDAHSGADDYGEEAVALLPHLIDCDFTCNGGSATVVGGSNTKSSPSTLDSGTSAGTASVSDDHVFERLCQQCMNYESCEDTANHTHNYSNCHEHTVNGETDMKVLNDLVCISNMYDHPVSKLAGQSMNLLHSSISGIQDISTEFNNGDLGADAHHHQHHHHHRIELHPHSSFAHTCDEGGLEGKSVPHAHCEGNINAIVDITSRQDDDSLQNIDTNTINFNWSFKNRSESLQCLWDDCNATFANLLDLQAHVFKQHIHGESISEHSCQWKDCLFLSSDADSLINHINGAHGIGFDAEILDRNSLKQQSSHHQCASSNAIKSREDGTFECTWDDCKRVFASRQLLNEHIESLHIPTGQSSYQCLWENCGKKFTQRQKLVRHVKVHTGYKPFKCSYCHKTFSTEDILSQHIRTHSGEKPFKCHYCDKKFTTSSSLRIHIRTHTGEKPLLCSICGKRFNESSNLSKHMKVHERRYMCLHCKRSFDKLEQYNAHMSKCFCSKESQHGFSVFI